MILLLSNVNIALPDFTALRANVAHTPLGPATVPTKQHCVLEQQFRRETLINESDVHRGSVNV
jgi:hypothetical protein